MIMRTSGKRDLPTTGPTASRENSSADPGQAAA